MDYCLNHDVSVSVWNYYIPVCLCYEGLFHGTADTCQTQMFIIADITKKLQASWKTLRQDKQNYLNHYVPNTYTGH